MQPDPAVGPSTSVKRVLIYRLGSLGDTTVALPCFHLIERAFPSSERILLTNFPVHAKAPASAAVLGDSGLVHGYMRYVVGTRSPMELLRLAKEIRRFAPEVLVYLMPVRSPKAVTRDKWFFSLAGGVKHIAGLPAAADLVHIQNPETGMYSSEGGRLARTIRVLGDAHLEALENWSLRLTSAEKDVACSALGDLVSKPLIVCGPGTKMQAKDWGQENWQMLLARLSERYPGHGLALIGAKEDADVSEFAARNWNGPKVNLCGRLSPRETAAVFEHAQVFLGPDSGPMHLAACAGVPCVIAFSARGLPGVWYPAGNNHRVIYHKVNCFGCNLETCIAEGRKCLRAITVEEMAAAVESVLGYRLQSAAEV
ncbi:MAG TPA: glycosyltransferase family 9 protein [Acidobacteriaceae bacterium]|nr:glycosyltransferase family 9 protein [Acidobacteriaceae bacterium]